MSNPAPDPVFRSARREALIVSLVLVVAASYTLTYCYCFGYGREPESLTFVLWFPDWVFWGIVAPWTACTVFASWFAFGVMRDEDLGGNNDSDSDDDSGDGDDFPPLPLGERRGEHSLPHPLGEGRGEGVAESGDFRPEDAHG